MLLIDIVQDHFNTLCIISVLAHVQKRPSIDEGEGGVPIINSNLQAIRIAHEGRIGRNVNLPEDGSVIRDMLNARFLERYVLAEQEFGLEGFD